MASGMHHINRRKRMGLEKFPHPNPWLRWFDKFLIIFAAVGPLVALPQVFKIYLNQSAGDLSILTWGLLTMGNIPWIVYGSIHKEKPLILAYSLWLLVNGAISLGILIYA